MPYNPKAFDVQVESRSDDPLEALRQANAKESYEWLGANSPDHLEAVIYAVEHGITPDGVYRAVLKDTFRHELAHRCRLAARWIVGQAVA